MKYKIEIRRAKHKVYVKRNVIGGKFIDTVLHIGEGRVLEYPFPLDYHKYISSSMIEKRKLVPGRSCHIAHLQPERLYDQTEEIWSGSIREEALNILLNYYNYVIQNIRL